MKKLIGLIPMTLAVVALGGCGSPKPIKYYAVQIPVAPSPTTHTYPVDLTVGRVKGSDLLNATPIVYKSSTHELGTYTYHRWTDAPVDMVQEKLVRILRKSGDYRSVVASTGTAAELTLRCQLYDFAEVDGAAITGLVSMEFELYSRKAAKVVWTHFYSQTEPVQGKLVPSVVEALDRNLDRGLNEVAASLNQYFAAHPPAAN